MYLASSVFNPDNHKIINNEVSSHMTGGSLQSFYNVIIRGYLKDSNVAEHSVSAKVRSLLSLNVFTRDVSIPVRSSLRSITPISVTKRAYLEWTTENCVTVHGY